MLSLCNTRHQIGNLNIPHNLPPNYKARLRLRRMPVRTIFMFLRNEMMSILTGNWLLSLRTSSDLNKIVTTVVLYYDSCPFRRIADYCLFTIMVLFPLKMVPKVTFPLKSKGVCLKSPHFILFYLYHLEWGNTVRTDFLLRRWSCFGLKKESARYLRFCHLLTAVLAVQWGRVLRLSAAGVKRRGVWHSAPKCTPVNT